MLYKTFMRIISYYTFYFTCLYIPVASSEGFVSPVKPWYLTEVLGCSFVPKMLQLLIYLFDLFGSLFIIYKRK